MPLGLVIIGFGSICRDGFLFGGRIPQSCAAGCSVRVQTSGPRWDTSGGLRLGSGQIAPRLRLGTIARPNRGTIRTKCGMCGRRSAARQVRWRRWAASV